MSTADQILQRVPSHSAPTSEFSTMRHVNHTWETSKWNQTHGQTNPARKKFITHMHHRDIGQQKSMPRGRESGKKERFRSKCACKQESEVTTSRRVGDQVETVHRWVVQRDTVKAAKNSYKKWARPTRGTRDSLFVLSPRS